MNLKYKKLRFLLPGFLMLLLLSSVPAQDDSFEKIEIERKPLLDFVDSVVTEWADKKVDLNKPFVVEMDVTLNESGKFEKRKTKFVRGEGEENLLNIAKRSLEAVGESGYFLYIKRFGLDNFRLVFAQDKTHISAKIVSETESPEKALATVEALGKLTSRLKTETKDITQIYLVDQLSAEAKQSQVTIKFALPVFVSQQILNYELRKASDRRN